LYIKHAIDQPSLSDSRKYTPQGIRLLKEIYDKAKLKVLD